MLLLNVTFFFLNFLGYTCLFSLLISSLIQRRETYSVMQYKNDTLAITSQSGSKKKRREDERSEDVSRDNRLPVVDLIIALLRLC